MALTGLPLQITSCSNRPGNSKEVILPSVTGKKLATTKEVKYGIITAIEWDARHFFWVLDKNGRYSIPKFFSGAYAPYFPWLGVGKGFGDQAVAWGSEQYLKDD